MFPETVNRIDGTATVEITNSPSTGLLKFRLESVDSIAAFVPRIPSSDVFPPVTVAPPAGVAFSLTDVSVELTVTCISVQPQLNGSEIKKVPTGTETVA